jgi:CRISPR-associated protein Csx10
MRHFGGYYCRQEHKPPGQAMTEMKVDMRLQTHTGINRNTGTVQDGILYNRQVFAEQARFMGIVKLPDEQVRLFEQFIQQVGDTGLVRVGTGRTRGLGKVHLKTSILSDERFGFTAFKQRLERFDQKLRTLTKQSESTFYFTLTLHAPAILHDALLRQRGSIDEETLHELTGLPKDSFKRIYQAASVQRVTGWNELWGTPRVQEYAIETGSVFLFAFTTVPNEDLYQTLFRLEETGIGQRRAEGFGRVCVSDPFHLEETLPS